MPMNAPITATGMATAGTMVARADARKAKITRTTSTTAMPSACTTSRIELVDERRVVGPDRDLHADRQVGSDQVELVAHPVGNRDGVGLGLAQHAETDRLAAVRADDALVILHAAFDARDVGEADRIAVDPLDHDVLELSDVGEPALRAHGELARGRLELAGRQLDVVAPQRLLDVIDREVARRHRAPVEPDADRIAPLAEDLDLRDALERRQPVEHEALDVVGDLGRAQPIAGDRDAHHRIGVAVALGDLRLVDVVGQFGADPRHRVPHVVGRLVDVPPGLELDHGAAAAALACGDDALDPGDAGDRALDHLGDVGIHDLGRGAEVGGGNTDYRGIDVRQLAHRQTQQGGHPEHDDQQAQHGREHRALDAKIRDHAPASCSRRGAASAGCFATRTAVPSRRRCAPSRTTGSNGSRPWSTSTLPAWR